MSNPVFRGWPSVADLLESPPLRALASRVQPQQLAADVGRFLHKIRTDLHNATAEPAEPVAPADLANRVATWIAAQSTSGTPQAVNATGCLFPDELGGPPLAETAATRLAAVARHPTAIATPGNRAAALAARRVGAEAATLFSHVAGGIATALAALAADGSALVARGQVLEIDGVPLPELARCAHATLAELGAANRATATQFNSAATAQQATTRGPQLVLGVVPTAFRWPATHSFPTWEALAAVARRHKLPLVVDLGLAGLTPVTLSGLNGLVSAAEALRAGVDLCFVRGDKLLGGPSCGIALGKAELIERLEAHPLRAAWRLPNAFSAALEATLQGVQPNAESTAGQESTDSGPGDGDSESPALRLLRASTENLRNRAERLAPQLAAIPGIAVAEARISHGSLVSPHDGWQIPSWSVFLQPQTGTAVAWLPRLLGGSPAVAGRPAGDWLELNLRTVLPSQDAELVAALEQLAPVP